MTHSSGQSIKIRRQSGKGLVALNFTALWITSGISMGPRTSLIPSMNFPFSRHVSAVCTRELTVHPHLDSFQTRCMARPTGDAETCLIVLAILQLSSAIKLNLPVGKIKWRITVRHLVDTDADGISKTFDPELFRECSFCELLSPILVLVCCVRSY